MKSTPHRAMGARSLSAERNDPDAEWVEDERVRQGLVALNEYRVGVVCEGRRALEDRLVGGLQREPFAARHYPPCVRRP